jgi:predicted outer membrane protein
MMRNNRALLTACCRLMLLAVFAPGLASAAPAAQAQSEPDKPAAASEPNAEASKPSTVEGVTVNAPRPQPGALGVPPDKAAALAAEAANNEAWRKYRESMPPLTSDPNDLSKDFPGLRTYVPQ